MTGLNRLEEQNRQIRRIVDPEEQKRLDALNEERCGKALLTITVITCCVIIVVLFALMCAAVRAKFAV